MTTQSEANYRKIQQWVEKLTPDNLFWWADFFEVDKDHENWLDDEYPDKTDDLRTRLVETMCNYWNNLLSQQPTDSD